MDSLNLTVGTVVYTRDSDEHPSQEVAETVVRLTKTQAVLSSGIKYSRERGRSVTAGVSRHMTRTEDIPALTQEDIDAEFAALPAYDTPGYDRQGLAWSTAERNNVIRHAAEGVRFYVLEEGAWKRFEAEWNRVGSNRATDIATKYLMGTSISFPRLEGVLHVAAVPAEAEAANLFANSVNTW